MSYAQFGYTAYPSTSQLVMSTTGQSGGPATSCCDPARPVEAGQQATAPTVCSLPATYDSRLLSTYPRLATGLTTPSGFYNGATYGADQTGYPNLASVESSAFYSSLNTAYTMKDPTDPWRGITQPASYYYDPTLAAYGYGGLDFNGTRRKNVTRDSTSTLKAWLNEHRKNPYPTKGEKIMLAIITKMTLTQVSTWFANARRRLKKENKMTWEPRNKIDVDHDVDNIKDEGDNKTDDMRDDQSENGKKEHDRDRVEPVKVSNDEHSNGGMGDSSLDGESEDDDDDNEDEGQLHLDILSERSHRDHFITPDRTGDARVGFPPVQDVLPRLPSGRCGEPESQQSPLLSSVADFTPSDSSSPTLPDIHSLIRSSSVSLENKPTPTNCPGQLSSGSKPKIWSLADTATSKSPPPVSSLPSSFSDATVAVSDNCSNRNGGGMLGNHCGWFSPASYHVGNPSTSISHLVGNVTYPTFASPPQASSLFSNSNSSASFTGVQGLSPVPPQTDTPPQTPPNLKVSTALPLHLSSSVTASYLSSQSSHLYLGPNGHLSAATQATKSSGVYTMNHVPSLACSSATYRSECLAEDYSTHAHYRSTQIQ